jgi:hypothetical protein
MLTRRLDEKEKKDGGTRETGNLQSSVHTAVSPPPFEAFFRFPCFHHAHTRSSHKKLTSSFSQETLEKFSQETVAEVGSAFRC